MAGGTRAGAKKDPQETGDFSQEQDRDPSAGATRQRGAEEKPRWFNTELALRREKKENFSRRARPGVTWN